MHDLRKRQHKERSLQSLKGGVCKSSKRRGNRGSRCLGAKQACVLETVWTGWDQDISFLRIVSGKGLKYGWNLEKAGNCVWGSHYHHSLHPKKPVCKSWMKTQVFLLDWGICVSLDKATSPTSLGIVHREEHTTWMEPMKHNSMVLCGTKSLGIVQGNSSVFKFLLKLHHLYCSQESITGVLFY